MKKWITKDVLKFMESTDTSAMNTNEFIIEFLIYKAKTLLNEPVYTISVDLLKKMESFESILRARRKIISDYWIWKRTNADTEQDYIDEYARKNKIHVI